MNRQTVAIPIAAAMLSLAGSLVEAKDYYLESTQRLRLNLQKQLGPDKAVVVPFEISEEAQERLRGALHWSRDASDRRRQILDFLIMKSGLAVQYNPRTTQTAQEVFERRTGNCLSLTSLYVGFARLAGLDAVYVHVTEIDRFSMSRESHREGTVIHSSHICAGVRDGMNLTLIDFAPGPTRQYHAFTVIDDVTAVAHYYNNLAYETGFFATDLDAPTREARELELYEMACRVKPDFFQAYNNIGALYRRRGDAGLALEYYQKAMDINPQFPEAYSNRASIFISQGKFEDAVAELLKSIRHNDDNPYIHHDLGQLYYAQGRYKDAESCFKRAVSRGEDALFHVSLARTRLMLGRPKDALSSVRKALEINPNHREALALLATIGEAS